MTLPIMSGFIFISLPITAAIAMGGGFIQLLNAPSLGICLLITLGALFMRFGLSPFSKSFFRSQEKKIQFLETTGWAAMHSGWIGTLIAAVQISQNMKDFNQLGPALSITLLTMFYGYLTWFICKVWVKSLECKKAA